MLKEVAVKKRTRATLKKEVVKFIREKRGFVTQLAKVENERGQPYANPSVIYNRIKKEDYCPTIDFLYNILEVGYQYRDFKWKTERALCDMNRKEKLKSQL